MVTKKLCNNHAALVATLLYSIIPIFVFYNRQALLEAGVACSGIWSCNALLNVLKKPTALNGVILGAIFGIGFFIKSSSLLFIVSSTLIIFFYLFIKRRWELVKPFVVSLAAFFLVDFILFINPTFWQTFHTNSRYSYTPAELLSFPLISWFMNFLGFFQIGFIFVTPLVFVFSIIGMFFLWKNKVKNNQLFLAYFLFALLLEIFASRGQIQRYLVSFLPFLVIPASYVLSNFWNGNILKKSVVIVSFFIPLVLTLVLIINPQYYISQLAKVSRYSDVGYIQGQTSGYGINEAMQYIQEHSTPSHPSLILTANNIGNPETAVFVYAQKNPQLVVLTITANSFPWIDEYKCMNSEGIIPIVPVFFVTRENQLSGMDRYFSEEKSFVNPDKKYSVRIYTFKKKCSGKTFNLLEQPDYRNNFIDALKTK